MPYLLWMRKKGKTMGLDALRNTCKLIQQLVDKLDHPEIDSTYIEQLQEKIEEISNKALDENEVEKLSLRFHLKEITHIPSKDQQLRLIQALFNEILDSENEKNNQIIQQEVKKLQPHELYSSKVSIKLPMLREKNEETQYELKTFHSIEKIPSVELDSAIFLLPLKSELEDLYKKHHRKLSKESQESIQFIEESFEEAISEIEAAIEDRSIKKSKAFDHFLDLFWKNFSNHTTTETYTKEEFQEIIGEELGGHSKFSALNPSLPGVKKLIQEYQSKH